MKTLQYNATSTMLLKTYDKGISKRVGAIKKNGALFVNRTCNCKKSIRTRDKVEVCLPNETPSINLEP